jgi:hypothetical protein
LEIQLFYYVKNRKLFQKHNWIYMKIRQEHFENANTWYHSHSHRKRDTKATQQCVSARQPPFNTVKKLIMQLLFCEPRCFITTPHWSRSETLLVKVEVQWRQTLVCFFRCTFLIQVVKSFRVYISVIHDKIWVRNEKH